MHALAICECLASIELAALMRDDLRFIPWSEILARAPEEVRLASMPFRLGSARATVIPDGLFGIEYRSGGRKAFRFFALEVDRGTMPVTRRGGSSTSVAAKLAVYEQLITSQATRRLLGIPNLFVLTVTSSEARAANLRATAESDCAPWFLFKAVDETTLKRPQPSLLIDAWTRPNLPPLSVAEQG
jgi:hypothetical protein